MENEFTNLKELYDRLVPALKAKKNELIKAGYDYITEEDIWDYLKVKRWMNSYNLLLYQMVDDIMNVDNLMIADFYKSKKGSD